VGLEWKNLWLILITLGTNLMEINKLVDLNNLRTAPQLSNSQVEKLLKGEINKQWKALMNFQLTRARDWFQKSEDGIKWLSSDARWPVWTSLRLYRGILDSIERLDYDVFNNRAFVKNSVKAFEIPISFLISRIK